MANEQIKISDLASSAISLTDFIPKADALGIANKATIQELSNLINTSNGLDFKGTLLIADTPVTGWYFAGESGTYTNVNNIVVTLTNNITILIVEDVIADSSKLEIPVTVSLEDTTYDEDDNVNGATMKLAYDKFNPLIDSKLDKTDVNKYPFLKDANLNGKDFFLSFIEKIELIGADATKQYYFKKCQVDNAGVIHSIEIAEADGTRFAVTYVTGTAPTTGFEVISQNATTQTNARMEITVNWAKSESNGSATFTYEQTALNQGVIVENEELTINKNDIQLIGTPSFRNKGYAYFEGNILTLTQDCEIPFKNSYITLSAGILDLSGIFRGVYTLTVIDGTTVYTLADLVHSSILKATELSQDKLVIGYTNEGRLYSPLLTSGVENFIKARETILNKTKVINSVPTPVFTNEDGYAIVEDEKLKIIGDIEIPYSNSFITISAGELNLTDKSVRGVLRIDIDGRATPYTVADITYDTSSSNNAKLYDSAITLGWILNKRFFSSIVKNNPFYDNKIKNLENNLVDNISFARGTSIILFGNSITEQNGPYSSTSNIYDQARGYWNMANFFLNQRFTKIYNAGIGGNTTIQMLARIQTDVIDKNPEVCFFMGGINDINTLEEQDESVIFGRLVQIYDSLTLNNIKIITSLVTPSVSSDPWKKDTLSNLNKLISDYAYSNPNIILVDMGKAIVDYSTGNPIAGWTDNTHPYDVAAFEMGWELAEKIRPFFKETPFLPYFKNDNRLLNANAFLDGDNSGLATGFVGTGISGTTFSKEVRADRLGEWQLINSPAVSTDDSVYNFVSNPENITFTQGDIIYGACEIEVDVTELRVCYFEIFCQDVNYATTYTSSNLLTLPQYTGVNIKNKKYNGIFKTEPFVIPANSTRVRARLFYDFEGEIKVGRVCVLKK